MSNHEELDSFRQKWRQEVAERLESGSQTTSRASRVPLSLSKLERIESPRDSAKSLDMPASHIANQAKRVGVLNASDEVVRFVNVEETPPIVKVQVESEQEETALELYEVGVMRERQGALSDALIYYRRAFKKDPQVDSLYRDAFRSGTTAEAHFNETTGTTLEESNYAVHVQTSHDYNPGKAQGNDEYNLLISMFSSIRLPMEQAKLSRSAGITALPDEILTQILTYAIVDDLANLTSISLTCQKMLLLTSEKTIWRELCQLTYRDQVYTEEGTLLTSSSMQDYLKRLDVELQTQYEGSYRRMFIEKPRIKYEGIYIATCHYIRPGNRENSLSLTVPVHLVTYFRYLRFFPSGKCMSLLTPTEPKDIVHAFVPNTKLKGTYHGRWSMDKDGSLHVSTMGPLEYSLFMDLRVRSTSRGRQNKLSWTKFYGVHPRSEQITEFNLKNDKSYFLF